MSPTIFTKEFHNTAPLRRRFFAVLVFAGLLAPSDTFSQSQHEIEYRFKAVYLFNFLKFTEWPDSVFESPSSPIIIGIAGDDPFGLILDETVQSENINGRPIWVKRFRLGDDITACHALFISPKAKEPSDILRRVADLPILTVVDVNNTGTSGGEINFYLANNKVRFEVDMHALQRSGVKLSSKLLRLAKIINPQ